MTTYYSKITYTATAAQDTFAIPFGYLAQQHLEVTVDDTEQTRGVDYTVVGTDIVFDSGISEGSEVVINRTTPIDDSELSVTFTDGSSIKGSDLNAAAKQSLYAIQEVADDATVLTADVAGAAKVTENLSDLSSAASARANLSVYSTTEVDAKAAGLALKANNLSDLTNAGTARENLDVYSKSETEAQIAAISGALQITNNLSDLNSAGAARTNLDVYAQDEIDTAIQAVEDAALLKSDNLASLDDDTISRTNLDVYSKAEVNAKVANILSQIDGATEFEGLIAEYEFDVTDKGKWSTIIPVPENADYFKFEMWQMPYGTTLAGNYADMGARDTSDYESITVLLETDDDLETSTAMVYANRDPWEDHFGYIGNADGSITRVESISWPTVIVGSNPDGEGGVSGSGWPLKKGKIILQFYAGTP